MKQRWQGKKQAKRPTKFKRLDGRPTKKPKIQSPEKKQLFQSPFAKSGNSAGNSAPNKKKRCTIPSIPMENPLNIVRHEGVYGHTKQKEALKNFLQTKDHAVAIVWGPPGIGKSLLVHVWARSSTCNMWPQTVEDLKNSVPKEQGKVKRLSDAIARSLTIKSPLNSFFFLDNVMDECMNNPAEIDRIVKCIVSEKFRQSGKKIIVELNNVYSKECSLFRRLLDPVKIKKFKYTIGVSIRMYPLHDSYIQKIVNQTINTYAVGTKGIIRRKIAKDVTGLAHGDGRQAYMFTRLKLVYVGATAKSVSDSSSALVMGSDEEVHTDSKQHIPKEFYAWRANKPTVLELEDEGGQMSRRDTNPNVFIACKAFFTADHPTLQRFEDLRILKELVHTNYPEMNAKNIPMVPPDMESEIYSHISSFEAGIEREEECLDYKSCFACDNAKDIAAALKEQLVVDDANVFVSGALSDLSCLPGTMQQTYFEQSSAVQYRQTDIDPPTQWPSNLGIEATSSGVNTNLAPMRQRFGLSNEDWSLVSTILYSDTNYAIRDPETNGWLKDHGIDQIFLSRAATRFRR